MYPYGLHDDETTALKDAFYKRVERRWFSRSRAYDAARAVDGKAIQKREDLLREVHGQIIGHTVKK